MRGYEYPLRRLIVMIRIPIRHHAVRAFAALAALLLLALAHSVSAADTELLIVTSSGAHRFHVEMAATPEQRERGLMFRREMAADAGMLFDDGPGEHDVAMWMKNTYIPLDMLFIRDDGTISSVAERAVPESLATIASDGPVRAVLEVNGGTAAKLGIKPGDKVHHALFGNAE